MSAAALSALTAGEQAPLSWSLLSSSRDGLVRRDRIRVTHRTSAGLAVSEVEAESNMWGSPDVVVTDGPVLSDDAMDELVDDIGHFWRGGRACWRDVEITELYVEIAA